MQVDTRGNLRVRRDFELRVNVPSQRDGGKVDVCIHQEVLLQERERKRLHDGHGQQAVRGERLEEPFLVPLYVNIGFDAACIEPEGLLFPLDTAVMQAYI